MSLDHNANVYLTITLSPSSPYYHNPSALAAQTHPNLAHVGKVGELADVQIVSVPKDSWASVQDDILRVLNGLEGVQRVDVQDPPKTRAKRGGDEL